VIDITPAGDRFRVYRDGKLHAEFATLSNAAREAARLRATADVIPFPTGPALLLVQLRASLNLARRKNAR
jgi:hypothetical protein